MKRLRLVKSMFLLRHDVGFSERFYDFVPYHHGPFSFVLYHELGKLESQGLVASSEGAISLTAHGDRVRIRPNRAVARAVQQFAASSSQLSTARMVSDIYQRHPWYTALAKDRRRRRMRRSKAEPAIYTVGYEGLQVDSLLNLLLRQGIEVVADTRSNPVSRRYGFHRSTLQRLCERLGMEYVHFPDLGIPGEWRREIGADDLPDLFSRYEREILPAAAEDLRDLGELMLAKPSVILCSELVPEHCHRHRLARRMNQRLGLPMVDLRCSPQLPLQVDA